MIQNRTVSTTEEKRIVTGLITSTDFTSAVNPVLDIDYFVNPYLQTVASWCIAFYEEHKKAPNAHIQDIFDIESAKLSETDSELIGILLTNASEQYDPETINVQYLTDTAFDYFRKRELEITVNNVSVLKDKGEYEEAEAEITKFTRVTDVINSGVLINPGDLAQAEEIYRIREEEDKNFFRFPGDLGKYLGYFKRGDVVGFYAPAKRGKSWTLIDCFKHGILSKRKSLFWSIEMTKTEILPRVYQSFIPMSDAAGMFPYPVFDCIKNQSGTCADRESDVIVLDNDEFIEDPTHKTCTKCMHGGEHEFVMTVYREEIYREQDDIFSVRKMLKSTSGILNKYSRLSVHPKYTLTYDKMRRDIDTFAATGGFIPDIFIIDYVDILDIGSRFDDYRSVDEAWKLMARMAGEYNVLVITATQANKEGHQAEVLNATHQGGFYGKNQHVNAMIGLNQTADEKEQGIMKFGISEARSQHFIPGRVCTVLQDFHAGQAYIDSYYG